MHRFVAAGLLLLALFAACTTSTDDCPPGSSACTVSGEQSTCVTSKGIASTAVCTNGVWCVVPTTPAPAPAGACPAGPPTHGAPCDAPEQTYCAYTCPDGVKGTTCNGGRWCGVVSPTCTAAGGSDAGRD